LNLQNFHSSSQALLINRSLTPVDITVPGATGGYMNTVDIATFDNPARQERVDSDSIHLDSYAVTVVTYPASN
jgi:hypothetical protein